MEYLDFEIEFSPGNAGDYIVAVIRSPAGEARESIRFPSKLQLASRLKDLRIALLRSGARRRRALSAEEQTVQEFGREMFDLLLPNEIRGLYRTSLNKALAQDCGLRLKLRLKEAPELAVLPWEFLYDPNDAEYVCLSQDTSIVRYIELPRPPAPLKVSAPLRILGLVASPTNLPQLDVAREKERVNQALADLQAEGLVELTWLTGQTWRDLKKALRQKWHIFHFIGHGGFDKRKDEGFVSLCDTSGQAHSFMASGLARLLANQRSLRMVLLNACEGGQGSGQDIFSSAASILVRRGMPAVLAMQYEISDRAAIELARSFYEALADGLPVDAAVTEARQSIGFAAEGSIEWVTPVLYMRSPDGKLFDVQAGAAPPVSEPTPTPKPPARRQHPPAQPEPPVESFTASYLAQLHKQLAHDFNTEELKGLCFDLDAEYDDLEGSGKVNKARELIRYLDRRGRVSELLALCEKERPKTNWREIKLRQAAEPTADPIQELTKRQSGRSPDEKPASEPTARQTDEQAAGTTRKATVEPEKTAQPTPKPAPDQCKALTKSGSRCRNRALDGGAYCGMHTKKPKTKSPALPKAPGTLGDTFIHEKTGLEFVRIPAGEFLYGENKKRIHLPEYWISKTPVTNTVYKQFIDANPTHQVPKIFLGGKNNWDKGKRTFKPELAEHPVVIVSWYDAIAFCKWAGLQLPTEEQWEKAARGGNGQKYPWGNNDPTDKLCNFNSNVGGTTPVGQYSPQGDSPNDCVDMSGNVWEWCLNKYKTPEDTNIDKSGDSRVLRGGSWYDNAGASRAAYRYYYYPDYRNYGYGFRVAAARRPPSQ